MNVQIVSLRESTQYVEACLLLWNENVGEQFPLSLSLLQRNLFHERWMNKDLTSFAFVEGELVGFIVVKSDFSNEQQAKNMVWISALLVDEKWRRKGIGTILLKKVMRKLPPQTSITIGMDPAHLFPGIPDEIESLKSFFRNNGFKLEGNAFDLRTNIESYQPRYFLKKNYQVRRLVEEEKEELVELIKHNFSERWLNDTTEALKDERTIEGTFGLFKQETLIGFAHVHTFHDKYLGPSVYWKECLEREYGGLGPIGIAEIYRGNGLGTAFFEQVLLQLQNEGITDMVVDWTVLLDYYGKFGFQPWRKYVHASKRVIRRATGEDEMKYSIGIDIGGTKIAAGIVTSRGDVLNKVVVPTPKSGKEEILLHLKQIVENFIQRAKEENLHLDGIGIGTAGQVHVQEGKILSGTANIKNWGNISLATEMESYARLPVFIDNDVNVLTLAESFFGAAKGYEEVVCLALGTGVGGGVITNGKLLHGTWGGAAELGHVSLDMNGEICNCGLKGCLETYASGTWIAKRMKMLFVKDGKVEKALTHVTAEEVFSLYHQQHPLATQVVQQMIHGLSVGIINFIHTFNPQIVVLGGGVMSNNKWILDLVELHLAENGLRSLVDGVVIRQAVMENNSGLIGAAVQVWNRQSIHIEVINA